MLAPMVMARPERAWRYAAICTAASVAGGILGYMIGYFLADFGQWMLHLMGQAGGIEQFRCWYARWGVWVILIKGLTPVPYKLVTIASGLAAFNFPMFIAASIVTRGARFALVAGLIRRFGPQIMPVLERRLALVAAVVVLLVVVAFLISHGPGPGSSAAC